MKCSIVFFAIIFLLARPIQAMHISEKIYQNDLFKRLPVDKLPQTSKVNLEEGLPEVNVSFEISALKKDLDNCKKQLREDWKRDSWDPDYRSNVLVKVIESRVKEQKKIDKL